MTDKEKIIRLHEKFGLEVQPVNAQIMVDCYNAIQGLEEAVHNLGVIWTMPDKLEAECALIKELAVVSSNATIMLNRHLPNISTPEESPADSIHDAPPF